MLSTLKGHSSGRQNTAFPQTIGWFIQCKADGRMPKKQTEGTEERKKELAKKKNDAAQFGGGRTSAQCPSLF